MKKLLFLLVLSLPGCADFSIKKPMIHTILRTPLETSIDISNSPNQTQPPPITIWIHGTRLLPKALFKKLFYSKPGLHLYSELEPHFHQFEIAQALIDSNPSKFCAETFYLFGWSGKLSFEERKKAAERLYSELKLLREQYKYQYGIEPVIYLITHSHGGNIALQLACVKDPSDTEFSIQQLILLACPVQEKTSCYIDSDLFKTIYSLYSLLDVTQLADPQGLQTKEIKDVPLFSKRHFPPHKKLEQVAIKLNNRSPMHIEFVQQKFLIHLSKIIEEIDKWKINGCSKNDYSLDKCIAINTKHKNTTTA